ncbi:MAG: GAF domain-containing protein, partial [Chloroflexi bacterium]|nr:GAF domain-containing protein [Chloroflexota bacterium]
MSLVSLYLALCWLSTLVAAGLWIFTWKRRHRMTHVAPWYLGMVTASILWSGGTLVGMTAADPKIAYMGERVGEAGSGLVSLFFVLTLLALWPQYRVWVYRLAAAGLFFHAWIHTYLSFLPVQVRPYTLGTYTWWMIERHDPMWERVLWLLVVYLPAVAGLILYRTAYRSWWTTRPRWLRTLLSLLLAAILTGTLLNILDVGPFAALEIFPPTLWLLLLLVGGGILRLHYDMTPALSSDAILRRIREGVLVFDAFDRLVWWNDEAAHALGLTRERHQNRSAEEVLRPWPDLLAVHQTSSGQPTQISLPIHGRLQHWEVVALALEDRQGGPLGRVLVFYDLTEYRRMERTLAFRAESEALYRNLIHLGQETPNETRLLARAAEQIYTRLRGFGLAGLAAYSDQGKRLVTWGQARELSPPVLQPELVQRPDAPVVLLEDKGRIFGAFWYHEAATPEAFSPRPILRQASHILVQWLVRHQEERRLRLMHEVYMQMSDAVMVFDARGQVLDMNTAAKRLLGLDIDPKDDTGNPPAPLRMEDIFSLDPDQRAAWRRRLWAQGAWRDVLVLRTRTGEERIVEGKFSLLRGGPFGSLEIAVLRDITEQETLRAALARQRALLAHLLRIARAVLEAPLTVQDMFREAVRVGQEVTAATDFGLLLLDEHGAVRDLVLATREPLPWPREQLLQWAEENARAGVLARVLTRPRPRYLRDLARLPWADQMPRLPWRSLALIPLMTGGRVLGLFIVGHPEPRAFRPQDRAVLQGTAEILALGLVHAQLYEDQIRLAQERLRAQEQAERLREQEERLLSNVSHEMRTPLQAILGYLEWIMQDAQPNTPYRALEDDLQKIAQAAQTLKQFIDQLLDYQRARKEQRVHLQRFRVKEVVDEVLDLVRPLIRRGQNQLHVHITPPEISLHSDPDKLRHILLNLLSNAAKFTRQGHITLRVQPQMRAGRPGVLITVADTGMGIPPE